MRKLILVGAICALAALAIGGVASGAASSLINGHHIKKGSIPFNRLSKKTRALIRKAGKPGAVGPVGPGGPGGPPGTAGNNAVVQVSSLASGSRWLATSGSDAADCGGTDGAAPIGLASAPDAPAAIGSNAVKFGPYGSSAEFGSITTHDFDGVKLKDLTVLDFDSFEQQAGTDYLRIFTNGNADDAVFAPNSQDAPTYNDEPVNQWVRYGTLDGTWRYNDDPGNGPQSSWDDIVAAHGDDTISALKVSAGCSAPGPTTAYIDHVVAGASGQQTTYDFGG